MEVTITSPVTRFGRWCTSTVVAVAVHVVNSTALKSSARHGDANSINRLLWA